jgi:uncharacterized membrane-anchored protein
MSDFMDRTLGLSYGRGAAILLTEVAGNDRAALPG